MPVRPCSGRICLGKCSGPCPNGYNCQKNSLGNYQCVKAPPSVWEQWWFWVVLIVGVILVILAIYFIYRAVRARHISKEITPLGFQSTVPTTTAVPVSVMPTTSVPPPPTTNFALAGALNYPYKP